MKASVEQRAVDAVEVGNALVADKAAAGKKYGVGDVNPVVPVRFTGTVQQRKSNYNIVKVEGMPEGVAIRVQTGPAINGTDLRDATGEIQFGQFKNQIEYQNAGSALNNEMKKQVLAGSMPKTSTARRFRSSVCSRSSIRRTGSSRPWGLK